MILIRDNAVTEIILTPPFKADPTLVRAGSAFAGQATVSETDFTLANDGWFPDISLKDFRTRRQIDDNHASERLIDVLQWAMGQVNKELKEWHCQQVRKGYESLVQVPSALLGQCSTKVLDYLCAVYSTAQARLNHRYWAVADTVGRTVGAQGASTEALNESSDEYQRERWEALQSLRDLPRTITGAL